MILIMLVIIKLNMMKNVPKKSSSIDAHFFQKKIMQHRNTTLSVNPKAGINFLIDSYGTCRHNRNYDFET